MKLIALTTQLVKSVVEKYSITSYDQFTCPDMRALAEHLEYLEYEANIQEDMQRIKNIAGGMDAIISEEECRMQALLNYEHKMLWKN